MDLVGESKDILVVPNTTPEGLHLQKGEVDLHRSRLRRGSFITEEILKRDV